MEVIISNNIEITNPNEEIIAWSKSNLTLSNPEYAKKLRMGFWLGNTPKTLNLYEVRGDKLVLPFGVLREILPMIRDSDVKTDFFGFFVILVFALDFESIVNVRQLAGRECDVDNSAHNFFYNTS